jgi:hypothetical protein
MAKHPFTKRDEQHELNRRTLIKWTIAAGVGLGVSRTRIHEILEKHAGKDVAFAASKRRHKLVMQTDEGGGGLSNWQNIIPYNGIAAAKNPTFTWSGGNDGSASTPFAGTPYPLQNYVGNPFGKLPAERQVSAFICGNDTTHNATTTTATYALGGKGTGAFAAEMQVTSLSSIIPALSIGATVGPSAVPFASAGNVAGAVNLFDSVASRTGGLVAIPANAALFASSQEIFAGLMRVAKNPIQAGSYKTAGDAAKFLGTNLAAQLTVTPADLARYGATGASNGATRYAQALSFAVKAFKLGLTNNIHFSGYKNDPHGFWDQGDDKTEPQVIRKIIATFMDELAATIDPITGEPLDRHLVWFIQGDTMKQARNRGGWPDGTLMNHSVVFAYTSGMCKAGWQGDHSATAVTTIDKAGKQIPYSPAAGTLAAQESLGAIAFAVANGDVREITPFAGNVDINARINPVLT